jgi:hypothetical protein
VERRCGGWQITAQQLGGLLLWQMLGNQGRQPEQIKLAISSSPKRLKSN